ncbi:hypothetical protein F4777DRAFT_323788 [Nemania sp. FL0916]|nr:hypothetical protein F4777DRAFT_323788 [Nemania sp. FL0916]
MRSLMLAPLAFISYAAEPRSLTEERGRLRRGAFFRLHHDKRRDLLVTRASYLASMVATYIFGLAGSLPLFFFWPYYSRIRCVGQRVVEKCSYTFCHG